MDGTTRAVRGWIFWLWEWQGRWRRHLNESEFQPMLLKIPKLFGDFRKLFVDTFKDRRDSILKHLVTTDLPCLVEWMEIWGDRRGGKGSKYRRRPSTTNPSLTGRGNNLFGVYVCPVTSLFACGTSTRRPDWSFGRVPVHLFGSPANVRQGTELIRNLFIHLDLIEFKVLLELFPLNLDPLLFFSLAASAVAIKN